VIYPSEFPIEFRDFGNTSKYFGHEKFTCPSKEVSTRIEPSKEWLLEVKRSSEAIQILSPSMTMPCSIRETNIEDLHNPTIGTSIMSEFLAKNLLGSMPLLLANKLFKSPSGLIFECCGIARGVPIKINETEVHLDFHIYTILEFELLIGHPLDNLFQEKPSHGSLSEEFGKTAFATQIAQWQSIILAMTRSRR
jgi:hypothetical protein